jgi:hypothetical protein
MSCGHALRQATEGLKVQRTTEPKELRGAKLKTLPRVALTPSGLGTLDAGERRV